MSNQSVAAGVSLAGVMAHCGGSPVGAVKVLVGAIASAPAAPQPYTALAELWRDRRSELKESLEECAAPWFGDARFLGAVGAGALAEACLRTLDYCHDLDTDEMRERFAPWFHALDVVSERNPVPESLAAMARLPRACGRYELSFALCDRADAVNRVMWTAVARAATWRAMGDLDQAAAAFEGALLLDPANWSLYLDLADLRAEQGDFAAAASLVEQGLEYEPHEVSLRAAGAAYRTRVSGSSDDLMALIALAPELANTTYRNLLIDYACAGTQLPRRLVAKAHRSRKRSTWPGYKGPGLGGSAQLAAG
ncbi:tetratricopeptide repeat protein [Streptomyces sp. NPDC086033]|uniref:tetratricopeptide repeat protein n=1 Tax=Streptomyces sp. NPDC086033 TaxID=3365747 RepID=UPI0037D45B99